MGGVPAIRIRAVNDAPPDPDGRHVLYWMISARRTSWNFALDRSITWARQLKRPLIILEPVRCGYRWASDRLHQFIIEGMTDNARRLEATPIAYYPYVERRAGAGKGLLAALSKRASVVVTDDFPAFFLPRMLDAAAREVRTRFEAIDSNGLLPLRASDQAFISAYQFRRFLQKSLPEHLGAAPHADPLRQLKLPAAKLDSQITKRWPLARLDRRTSDAGKLLTRLPIDHAIGAGAMRGGSKSASRALKEFFDSKLTGYLDDRNQPDDEGTSGLSPYLHFGHLAVHEVFSRLMHDQDWSPEDPSKKATGSKAGWWNVSEAAEAFLDQLVTWRELGFNMCAHRDDFDQYDSLPRWALTTLDRHAKDRRPSVYTLDEFERAATHDPLWNAAQVQLTREGRLHNYMRMLWGKKILEWSASPRDALAVMIELNNKFALDGRDPNSYSGIFWVLGRYDRPWGPERPIFGKVRYMSSENTARKVSVREYVRKYAS
jgi:deoxyribodipyrimidine photo-lyase